MKRNNVPLLVMRAYPEKRSGLFVRVNVWATKKDMHRHVTWMKPPFEALCSGRTVLRFGKNGKPRMTPEIAEVNFYKARCGSAVVTHEFTHAVLCWARRIGLDPAHLFGENDGAHVHTSEERFCHALDRMVGTFVDRAYKTKLY